MIEKENSLLQQASYVKKFAGLVPDDACGGRRHGSKDRGRRTEAVTVTETPAAVMVVVVVVVEELANFLYIPLNFNSNLNREF
ncbi:hypothetical protein E2C01_098311 [Portunus trituberculatus]|uniref:Uncharacterized protein n=1 Tax=Portunus trituberculatus TaxID=210409 RepID=A0A5B7K2P5_PORTR|nr:hypothetical protein [Portunus trituberculatus]